MPDDACFGAVHWSLDGTCAYLPIVGTSTFFQIGPFDGEDAIHCFARLREGTAPSVRQLIEALPQLKSLAWSGSITGSYPSVEIKGSADALEVRLLDVAETDGNRPVDAAVSSKGDALARLGDDLKTLLC
jgi:hypothetical protein